MKRSELVVLAVALIAISTLTYFIHYLIFHDPHHIFIFLVGDIAFVFLEVFLVVLVIERLLTRREKQPMLNKLNMIAGAFFSEVGNRLLSELVKCYERQDVICPCLDIGPQWGRKEYKKALEFVHHFQDKPVCSNIDLDKLRDFLVEKRPFILRLIENPNVLEHEHGSNLLWAVLHLTEALEARSRLGDLTEDDREYLSDSIQRVYRLMAAEWINYVHYLQSSHPFLFSLTLKTHPFHVQTARSGQ